MSVNQTTSLKVVKLKKRKPECANTSNAATAQVNGSENEFVASRVGNASPTAAFRKARAACIGVAHPSFTRSALSVGQFRTA